MLQCVCLTVCLTSGLLESLDLSGESQRVLRLTSCDLTSIPAFADAGWELHQRLTNLQVPPPLSPSIPTIHPSTHTLKHVEYLHSWWFLHFVPGLRQLYTATRWFLECVQAPAAAGSVDQASQLQHRAGRLPKLSSAVANMVAVQQQRERLKQLISAFVDKVAAFLQQQLGAIADSTIATLQSYAGSHHCLRMCCSYVMCTRGCPFQSDKRAR